uniref:Putative secreted protein n=1 Tax=Anopheles triannulatus TaxID=58253 RepID=A0A2M4B468_9DIPT
MVIRRASASDASRPPVRLLCALSLATTTTTTSIKCCRFCVSGALRWSKMQNALFYRIMEGGRFLTSINLH